MRITALILGILGGLAAAFLGATWLSDAHEQKAAIDAVKSLGVDTGELDAHLRAAYLLLMSAVGGIAGAVVVMKRKANVAAGVFLASAILPALLVPKVLVFTFLLVLAAVFAFLSKPKAVKRVPQPA